MTHPSTPQKPKKCGRERQASSDNPEVPHFHIKDINQVQLSLSWQP